MGGGEEFVMVLAEKIRAMVENLEIMHGEERLHVIISLDVSTYTLHAGEKEKLICLADAPSTPRNITARIV